MKTLRLKLLAVMLMRIAITDNLYAQSKGKISGSTKDAKTHEAVSFVTVTAKRLFSKRKPIAWVILYWIIYPRTNSY
jgi:hypothetical protein